MIGSSTMRIVLATAALALASATHAFAQGAGGAAGMSQSLGFAFTQAQVAGGLAIYARSCASCHGSKLEGQGGAPALAGAAFARRWLRGDRSYGDLDHAIRAMPKQQPGSLAQADYAALMAYVLSANGFATTPWARSGGDLRDMLYAPAPMPGHPAQVDPAIAGQVLPARPEIVAQAQTSVPNDADLLHPAVGDWLMFNRTYSGSRFSPLAQINAANAGHLQPVCILSLGVLGSFQGSPLIYQGMGFIGSTYDVFAFDAATCERKWTYSYTPKGPEGITTSRGIAIYDGKVFRGTPDGHLLALDMHDGKLLWDAHVADGALGYSVGAAPIVFEGRVIVGLAGGDYGNTGHIYAFNARTGAREWTFDTIDRRTWPKGAENGGGGSWTSVAVDAERHLVFVPVGNPAPDFHLAPRPGANLYTDSIVALDTATGKVAWYVQQIAEDYHDWDTSAAPILYEQDGRRLMAVANKSGYLYIYDRDTHQLVSRTSVVPRLNDELPFSQTPLRVCPGSLGGVEWNGPAYDPASKSLDVNSVHWCSIFTAKPLEGKQAGSMYLEADVAMDPPELMRGWTYALDATTGKVRWSREAPRPMIGAVTPTAGGVVLTGGGDGLFLVLDQHDGQVLYRFNTGAAIGGGVATYTVAGRQYVAVATGGFGFVPFGVTGAPTLVIFSLPPGTN